MLRETDTLPDHCIAVQRWYKSRSMRYNLLCTTSCHIVASRRLIVRLLVTRIYHGETFFIVRHARMYYCGKLTSGWFKLRHEVLILIFSDCSNKYYARCAYCVRTIIAIHTRHNYLRSCNYRKRIIRFRSNEWNPSGSQWRFLDRPFSRAEPDARNLRIAQSETIVLRDDER